MGSQLGEGYEVTEVIIYYENSKKKKGRLTEFKVLMMTINFGVGSQE